MKAESPSLDSIVQLLKSAQAELQSAEHKWLSALNQEPHSSKTEESLILEELLDEVTHEIGSSLAFYINDIETMIAKMRIRTRFTQYSNEQFKQIVQQGWSLGLVRELHNSLPDINLEDHSSAIRSIYSQWSSLPKLAHSYLRS